jgi:hypothetical protein
MRLENILYGYKYTHLHTYTHTHVYIHTYIPPYMLRTRSVLIWHAVCYKMWLRRTFLALNTWVSQQAALPTDAHLAEGQVLLEDQTLNNNNNININFNSINNCNNNNKIGKLQSVGLLQWMQLDVLHSSVCTLHELHKIVKGCYTVNLTGAFRERIMNEIINTALNYSL